MTEKLHNKEGRVDESKVDRVRYEIVHIKKDRTLFSVAREYYGDGDRWPELVPPNQDLLASHAYVREGTDLLVPREVQPSGL